MSSALFTESARGARTTAQHISGQLYFEDREHHYQAIIHYDDPELLGDGGSLPCPMHGENANFLEAQVGALLAFPATRLPQPAPCRLIAIALYLLNPVWLDSALLPI